MVQWRHTFDTISHNQEVINLAGFQKMIQEKYGEDIPAKVQSAEGTPRECREAESAGDTLLDNCTECRRHSSIQSAEKTV